MIGSPAAFEQDSEILEVLQGLEVFVPHSKLRHSATNYGKIGRGIIIGCRA